MNDNRTYIATKAKISDRGIPPDSFLDDVLAWAPTEPESVFSANAVANDIYAVLRPVLGPWQGIAHRRAVMCEALTVLAGYESSWNWNEGRDTSAGPETPEEQETGAFQVSYDSRLFPTMSAFLSANGITSIGQFLNGMKSNHALALGYAARLLRQTVRANGPILRGDVARSVSRDAVAEFTTFLA